MDVKRSDIHYYSLKLKALQGIIKFQLQPLNDLCLLCLCFFFCEIGIVTCTSHEDEMSRYV